MSFWSADSTCYVNLDCIGYTTKKYLQYITNNANIYEIKRDEEKSK